jgi:hypothetical protein
MAPLRQPLHYTAQHGGRGGGSPPIPTDHWPSGFAAPAPKSRPLAEPELAFRNQTSILEEVRRSAAVEIGSSEGGKTCRRNGSGPWAVSVHLSLIVSSPSCIGTFLGHLSENLQLSGLLIGWGTFLRGLLLISFFFRFLVLDKLERQV